MSGLGNETVRPPPAAAHTAVAGDAVPQPPTLVAGPRRRLIFGVVSIALLMASVDQTIVATALPAIQHDLHARVNIAAWTITVYSLGQVLALPVAGKMSDQFGRKKVFLISAVVFTAASLCCGFANSIYLLVILRAVQAIGGGAFMPSATGIVSDQFGKDRDRAVGMFASIFPIGGIIGPILGGIFVATLSWRWIFLVNVPVGIVLVVLAMRFIPTSKPGVAARTDISGIALLGLVLLSGMLGITYLGTADLPLYNPVFVGCMAVALLAGVLFVRHSIHSQAPFIPIELLRGRGFGVMNAFNFLFGSAALGFAVLVPLYAEQRFGLSALAAGTLLTARAVGMISSAGLAVFALRRTGYRLPMIVGSLLVATGLIVMSFPPHGVSIYAWLAMATAITGVGMGISVPASNNASLQLAPQHVAGIAGLRGMFRQTGAIVAVSITTAILARSQDPGITQAYVFVVFAAILVATIPLIFLVPEHRGGW